MPRRVLDEITYSFPKLQRCLGMDKQFHPTFYKTCDHLSMLGLKLIHVNKEDPCVFVTSLPILYPYVICRGSLSAGEAVPPQQPWPGVPVWRDDDRRKGRLQQWTHGQCLRVTAPGKLGRAYKMGELDAWENQGPFPYKYRLTQQGILIIQISFIVHRGLIPVDLHVSI